MLFLTCPEYLFTTGRCHTLGGRRARKCGVVSNGRLRREVKSAWFWTCLYFYHGCDGVNIQFYRCCLP
jgi:hypothetical protein